MVELDLEDNCIGPDGAIYIAEALKENLSVTYLVCRCFVYWCEYAKIVAGNCRKCPCSPQIDRVTEISKKKQFRNLVVQIAQEVVELVQMKVHTEWARKKRIEFNAPSFCNRLQ